MAENNPSNVHDRWAELRLAVVGTLLASPPEPKGLADRIRQLAEKNWRDPVTGDLTTFSFSTIERWYYKARKEDGCRFGAFHKKVRSDVGTRRAISPDLLKALDAQYHLNTNWSIYLVSGPQSVTQGGAPTYAAGPRLVSARLARDLPAARPSRLAARALSTRGAIFLQTAIISRVICSRRWRFPIHVSSSSASSAGTSLETVLPFSFEVQ